MTLRRSIIHYLEIQNILLGFFTWKNIPIPLKSRRHGIKENREREREKNNTKKKTGKVNLGQNRSKLTLPRSPSVARKFFDTFSPLENDNKPSIVLSWKFPLSFKGIVPQLIYFQFFNKHASWFFIPSSCSLRIMRLMHVHSNHVRLWSPLSPVLKGDIIRRHLCLAFKNFSLRQLGKSRVVAHL